MPYWTVEFESLLKEMVEQGKSLEELAEYFHRSPEAIRLKCKRMGLALPQRTQVTLGSTTTLPAIKPASELLTMEEMMKTMLGALDQLKAPQGLSTLELRRCRVIVALARTYMHMLERYEKWTDIEQRMVNMEARTLEMYKQQLEREMDPVRKAEVEAQIKQLEESLAQSSKYYKPFPKKLNLRR